MRSGKRRYCRAVFVRELNDAWQIVLQPDHGDLAGQLVRAWSPRPEPFASLELVARRHDDGWAVWERAPALDDEGHPQDFLDVPVLTHLAFYRAGIAAVADQDPYAGLLLSMHGAGIYTGRYGTQPELKLTFADEAQERVDAFVAEQEEGYDRQAAAVGIDEDDRRRDYRLLQVWDRLAIYFSWRDVETGTPASIDPVPRDGGETTMEIRPAGPWRVALDPFPFSSAPATFTLRRRLIPKRAWRDGDAFLDDFFAASVETVTITVDGA